MKRSSRPRTAAELSKSLHQRLNAYALAASAAGVGLLALVQPAEAKIVYTKAHKIIAANSFFQLDLNHDGIVDFYVLNAFSHFRYRHDLSVCQVMMSYQGLFFCRSSPTNEIRAAESFNREFAAALHLGAKIQRGDRFGYVLPMGGLMADNKTSRFWYGPWANGGNGVKDRYLGLKFKIKGRFHFGWARLTVKTTSDDFTAILTGYAYETIPGKAIIAGATKGPDDDEPTALNRPAPEPATLGILALGAPGLEIWRREESVVDTPGRN